MRSLVVSLLPSLRFVKQTTKQEGKWTPVRLSLVDNAHGLAVDVRFQVGPEWLRPAFELTNLRPYSVRLPLDGIIQLDTIAEFETFEDHPELNHWQPEHMLTHFRDHSRPVLEAKRITDQLLEASLAEAMLLCTEELDQDADPEDRELPPARYNADGQPEPELEL